MTLEWLWNDFFTYRAFRHGSGSKNYYIWYVDKSSENNFVNHKGKIVSLNYIYSHVKSAGSEINIENKQHTNNTTD